ncbi:EPIDERMAL PATTERNING FACTOR-like protein 5 [Carex rostrata]
MGLRRSVLYGALFMKMFILCGIPFCLFVVFAYDSSSEPRGFRLKHRAQVELQRLGRESMLTTRRMLLGPGSHPPRCTTKCGHCLPCQPVHLPVSPGSNVIMEYYPEAWRCKCGDRLYIP